MKFLDATTMMRTLNWNAVLGLIIMVVVGASFWLGLACSSLSWSGSVLILDSQPAFSLATRKTDVFVHIHVLAQ